MSQYDYDFEHDFTVLEALVKVWDPPWWAGPYTRSGKGNCVEAACFAANVLAALHVHREVIVSRARGWGASHREGNHSIGWGDCGTFMAESSESIPGHAVVVGYGWLFDAAAAQLGAPHPLIVRPSVPGEWRLTDGERNYVYTWAPGLGDEIYRGRDRWGHGTHAKRLAKAVREIAGPCRKQHRYSNW